MRILGLVICFCLVTSMGICGTYTGKAESVKANDRGIGFTVVVKNDRGIEVLRREQWVSTGVMTGTQAVDAIKNQVDRMTQEMYAHKEGAKEVLSKKAELEAYSTSCDRFIAPESRPSPQDTRIAPIE